MLVHSTCRHLVRMDLLKDGVLYYYSKLIMVVVLLSKAWVSVNGVAGNL